MNGTKAIFSEKNKSPEIVTGQASVLVISTIMCNYPFLCHETRMKFNPPIRSTNTWAKIRSEATKPICSCLSKPASDYSRLFDYDV